MRLYNILFVSCLSLSSLVAHAETVNNLYQVREPVTGQTPDERTQATQRALQTLVLRLTGDAKAINNGGLAAVRKDPQQIISQYGYDAGPPQSLQVDFDPVSTDKQLHQAGLATWGSNRPSILGWWLNDTADGTNLIGDGQATAEPLRRAAQHRGLPLRLPLADLSEQLVGTPKNLEGTDPAPLRGPSERYGADALLAVHAHADGSQWQAKWRLWLGSNKPEQGTAEGTDQASVADAVMLAVSQRLAPRYLAKPGTSSELTLQVQGNTLEHYGELSRLLEPFGGRVLTVDGDSVTYAVTGSTEQLRAQLALAKLQEGPAAPSPAPIAAQPGAAPTPPAAVASLTFHW